jgi:hypothetical protein
MGEIWHWCHLLSESNALNRETKRDVARHCWGAFADAACYRFEHDDFLRRSQEFLASPTACLSVVVSLFVAVALVCTTRLSPFASITANRDLWTVSFESNVTNRFTPMDSEEFFRLVSRWRQSKLLNRTAEYSWAPGDLVASKHRLSILWAQVAPEFFQLVKTRPTLGTVFGAEAPGCGDCVLISADLWRLLYGRHRDAIGRPLTIDGRKLRIIGVLPDGPNGVGPGINAWTLFDPTVPRFRNYMERFGAVVRLADATTPAQAQAGLNQVSDLSFRASVKTQITVSSVEREKRRQSYSEMVFLSMAIAGVIGIVVGSRPSALFARQDLAKSFWWWIFFAAKVGFALATAYMVSFLLVGEVVSKLIGRAYPVSAQLTVWLFVLFAVFILPVAIQDQRVRCRRCLRLLRMPVQIGRFGSPLLERAGTEMMCPFGHGALFCADPHPGLERDQWTVFDDSWSGLFAAGHDVAMR